MLDLAFRPDRNGATPLYRQLGDYLRELIGTGRLAAGEKLPATREVSAALGVGRNTVNQAYQALIDDGVLVAHVGQGTFVSSRGAALRPVSEPRVRRAFAWEGLFSKAARLPVPRSLHTPGGRRFRFDFAGGRIDEAALPVRELKRAYSQAIGERLPGVANELDPLGYRPLRVETARLLVSRGIACEPDEVLMISGAQQALDLVGRVLIDPGDAVVVEQPGYFGASLSFRSAGAQLVGVDVDREGLRTDALARALRAHRPKLVYTTPAAQMPTGVALSDARRQALLELADETQTPILEDDYDSEFRYGNPPLPALKTQDPAGQVIYVGTFSKALFPGLRLGYVVAARPLLERLTVARFSATFCPDVLAQVAVAEMLASGAFERHVRRLRKRYAQRRNALLDALERSMPEDASWTLPQGGLGVWVSLGESVDTEALRADAVEAGIAYIPGQACFFDGRGANCLGLSFANQTPDAIAEGIEQLGALVGRQQRTRRSA